MIEIILSVCLIQQPDRCRDVTLTMMANSSSLYQCMTYGQIKASKWSNEHPEWVLKKYKCTSRPLG